MVVKLDMYGNVIDSVKGIVSVTFFSNTYNTIPHTNNTHCHNIHTDIQ
jgi:hypothetical protein